MSIIGPNVEFFLENSGYDWALFVRFFEDGDRTSWTVQTWKNKPAKSTVENVMEIAMRSFDIYHKNINWPRFNLKNVGVSFVDE